MALKLYPYENKLKKLNYTDIEFNFLAFTDIESLQALATTNARDVSGLDVLDFREMFLSHLSNMFNDEAIKVLIITPKKDADPYEGFVYFGSKHIGAFHFEDSSVFKVWMDVVFERSKSRMQERKNQGMLERQQELEPETQFILSMARGDFSITTINSGFKMDEIYQTETGKWLHKKAPDKYNTAKIAREKRNYLKKYVKLEEAECHSGEINNAFTQYLNKHGLEVSSNDNFENLYSHFEEMSGFGMPQDIRDLCKLHNGIDNFLNLESIINEWKGWKEIYDEWMLMDLRSNSRPDGRFTLGMYTTPYWIPFYSTGGGNFIAIDYAPASKGIPGQIISFGSDEDTIRKVADSLPEFIQMLNDE